MQFVTCRVGGQVFGVDIMAVREVNQVLEITPIPGEKPYIKGLINLRGQIVTIIDVGTRLGIPRAANGGGTHNIIVKGGQELREAYNHDDGVKDIADPSGLLVDAIGDVVDAADDEIEPPPANVGAVEAAYLTGVVKREDALIAILNVPRVLAFG